MASTQQTYAIAHQSHSPNKSAQFIKHLFPDDAGIFVKCAFFLYYLAVPATILSWCFEIFLETSLCSLIAPWLSCPTLLRASVVLEVMKAVGISSAFIMFVLNSLDKSILGIRYSEVIHHHYPYYWVCSIIHITFTIGGIASGVAGASESALASLFIVLFGLAIQWQVMHNIILSKNACEKLADSIWLQRIENATSSDEMYSFLQQLAEEISQCNSHIPSALLNRFTDAFLLFASKGTRNIRITQIGDIWAIILHERSCSSTDLLTGIIISACINNANYSVAIRRSSLITICGGFIAYLLKSDISNELSQDDSMANALPEKYTKSVRDLYNNLSCSQLNYHTLISTIGSCREKMLARHTSTS